MGAESDNAVDISVAVDRNHSCMALHVHADDSSTIVRSEEIFIPNGYIF